MSALFLNPGQVAQTVYIDRHRVDAAIASGALAASDASRQGANRRAWRVFIEDAVAWAKAGYPTERAA